MRAAVSARVSRLLPFDPQLSATGEYSRLPNEFHQLLKWRVLCVRVDFAWGESRDASKSKITWACPQIKGATQIFPEHLPSVA